MMKYGMVKEGVECIANIRARYDGEKANPYNEAEYGRHYARAMASWGAIPMLSGFLYNAPARELVIKPLIHVPNFACFWSTPTGWGNFQITSEKGASGFASDADPWLPRVASTQVNRQRFPSSHCEIVDRQSISSVHG